MKTLVLSSPRLRRIKRKMFELVKEKVEIVDKAGNKQVYEIGPLTGEYIEDLYYVMDKFQNVGEGEKEILKVLGTDASKRLHKLIYASLALSYPDVAKEGNKLNQFVSQHLMKFVEALFKVNLPQE